MNEAFGRLTGLIVEIEVADVFKASAANPLTVKVLRVTGHSVIVHDYTYEDGESEYVFEAINRISIGRMVP